MWVGMQLDITAMHVWKRGKCLCCANSSGFPCGSSENINPSFSSKGIFAEV